MYFGTGPCWDQGTKLRTESYMRLERRNQLSSLTMNADCGDVGELTASSFSSISFFYIILPYPLRPFFFPPPSHPSFWVRSASYSTNFRNIQQTYNFNFSVELISRINK